VTQADTDSRRIRVAIIGGGCAGMTAAFELTRPSVRDRFAVTVYQQGWRLGGKGASGRGPAGRIEEHGLHLWMGFYDNAFGLMRDCYAELDRDRTRCPIADWRDAFSPAPFVGIADRRPDGAWVPWMAHLPATPGLPGDPYPNGARWSVVDYLVRSTMLLRTLFESLQAHLPDGSSPEGMFGGVFATGDLVASATRFLGYGTLAGCAALIHGVTLVEAMLRASPAVPDTLVERVLDAITSAARAQIEARAASDPQIRRLWTIGDLTLATMRGMLRSGLLTDPRGFDAIDDYDCREWLMSNGATEASVDSGYLRGLYDLGFSYEDADPAKPRIAASQALRSMLRAFFTYRGAFFWRMHAGMGDVVFAPLYEVLRRRGVRFEFFHRLENVGMRWDDGAPHVGSLEFDVQARTLAAEYRPLVDVGGLPCWPSAPDWSQLADGARLERERVAFESFWDTRRTGTRTLRVGDDFDLVVLAVGGGAVPHVCREIVARDARWRTMVARVKTVATQAFQVWLRADMDELGWRHPAINLSGFVEPFDTWADMRHLIARERWTTPPRSLAYFCNVLADGAGSHERTDATYPAAQRERVRANAVRFLERDVRHLWPAAVTAAGFRWPLLVAPDDASGGVADADATRFATQFWTANVNPSDRYTLSLPGTSALRISPLDGTYDNLTVAGDWTACGFNAGCVEAAVMSGKLAAHAIALSPRLEDIVGYDHP
jgi:uncharacterized protein with NAD-binding domain and iron-sulfur cluster